jgi:hypothetical protein
MKRQLTGGLRRSILLAATLAASATLAVGFASAASAYGGGATHGTYQVGISGNCNNPSFCGEELGGFWGWVEFDVAADGTITGDAQLTDCGHFLGGGGGGGAHHSDVDITSAHIGPAQEGDPGPGQVFYIDSALVNGVPAVPGDDALGDSGIPAAAGHYSAHPAPGVSGNIQVSFRPAK